MEVERMKEEKKSAFDSARNSSAAAIDPDLAAEIARSAADGKLACAAAFEVSARTGKTPAQIGRAADGLGVRLIKCQLGLFGYTPEKKIVNPAPAVNPELAAAIREKLENGCLACSLAWDLAKSFNLPRMAVSAACEALGVKIKPCQLGAF
jgi:hypothetical protein